jgi:kinesin family member C2/C3
MLGYSKNASHAISIKIISLNKFSFRLDYILDLINTLEIRSSSQKGGLAVPDANIVPVYSPLDVIELMNVGHRNRAVGFTSMNDRSSRSHRS